ncbi:MAG TPA: tandem-95 repeat protein [Chryseolinea sp.]|nr:tandem-95 repeat protein [Chryseolinea sp.]
MRSVLVILGCLLIVLSIDASGQMMDDFVITDEDDRVTFSVTDNDAVFLPQPNTVDLNTTIPGRQTTASTSEGTYSVNNGGDVTFDPANNFFGSSSLQYSMNYGFFGLTVGTATIYVTVNSVNDRPVTKDDEEVTNEDTPKDIKVLANDTDMDDGINPGSIIITDAEGGTFVPNASGEVTFTPTLDFSGNAKAKYTVEDFAGATSNKSDIKIRVDPVNDPPVVIDDDAITDEGVPIIIKILANDHDIDGSIVLSSVVISNESGGTFVANNKGEVTFTPANGAKEATATYDVQDNEGQPSIKSATIRVTINSVNDPPVAINDIVSTQEDASLLIEVTKNDKDDVGINLASVALTNMVNGTFVANSSGVVTYTPPPNFNGIASAKYTVKDNEGAVSNEATITVTVSALNDPPSFDPIPNQRVLKNTGNKTITITGITAGPLETETLTFSKPTSGSPDIVPNPSITYNGTGSTATLTFKPQPNKSGTALITVELVDQGGITFPRTFTIEVIDVEFTSMPITIAATGQLYEYNITITAGITETLSIVATQKPAWTTLAPNGTNQAKLSGTPPGNAPLANPVTLQLKDGATVLDQQQFTITINRPPTVSAFGITTTEDIAAEFSIEDFENAFTDPDNQSLAEVMITKLPEHGTLKLGGVAIIAGATIPSGSISDLTYNPTPDYNGIDAASWKGSDGYSFSQNEANIDFLINPANDKPVIEFIESENLQYELGSEVPIKLTSGIRISDPDDLTLGGAEIRIDFFEYESDKEELLFKDTLNITGNFNRDAGILLLTGNSSIANYQAALRKVKYNYVNLDQVILRTFNVHVTLADGKSTSDPKSRSIEFIYTFKHLDIPSAFSPNGDRTNEAWVIKSPNTTDGTVPYTDAQIRVYNKRGLLVYEAKGFEKPWDGTFGGKELPVDTYYYTIDLKYNKVRYKGVVTILR